MVSHCCLDARGNSLLLHVCFGAKWFFLLTKVVFLENELQSAQGDRGIPHGRLWEGESGKISQFSNYFSPLIFPFRFLLKSFSNPQMFIFSYIPNYFLVSVEAALWRELWEQRRRPDKNGEWFCIFWSQLKRTNREICFRDRSYVCETHLASNPNSRCEMRFEDVLMKFFQYSDAMKTFKMYHTFLKDRSWDFNHRFNFHGRYWTRETETILSAITSENIY